jgi:hypothetical protein
MSNEVKESADWLIVADPNDPIGQFIRDKVMGPDHPSAYATWSADEGLFETFRLREEFSEVKLQAWVQRMKKAFEELYSAGSSKCPVITGHPGEAYQASKMRCKEGVAGQAVVSRTVKWDGVFQYGFAVPSGLAILDAVVEVEYPR